MRDASNMFWSGKLGCTWGKSRLAESCNDRYCNGASRSNFILKPARGRLELPLREKANSRRDFGPSSARHTIGRGACAWISNNNLSSFHNCYPIAR